MLECFVGSTNIIQIPSSMRTLRRRWARAALVACLVLTIAAVSSHGYAREMSLKRPPKETAVTVAAQPCNITRTDNCSSVDDDKRMVPTGPNPLHNR